MNTLFISDLHLDGAYPAAIAQFEAFLAGPARAAEALYILGDLFESWVGDDDDDPDRLRVCQALRQLSRAGIACHVCHGNRDFLLGAGFAARTGCRILADPMIVERYGERVLLTHGDVLCTDDTAYQRLRSVVRDPAWQRRFLRLPLATRRVLADAAREGSRTHTGMMAADIMDANQAAVNGAACLPGAHAGPRSHPPARRARIRPGRRAGAPLRTGRVVRAGQLPALGRARL